MINTFSNKNSPANRRPKIFKSWKILLAAVLLGVFLALPVFTFFVGVLAFPSFKVAFNPIVHTTGIDWRNKAAVVNLLTDLFKLAPQNFIAAWLGAGPPTIDIDVNFKNFDKLSRKRTAALQAGYLKSESDDFVAAKIRVNGSSVKVKLRLKGDLLDHLGPRKWSFRVHTKGEGQVFGLRRFSIQAPRVREFQREPVYLDHLRREGVLAVRYFFVAVRLNGDDLGIMAIEENFSKELLENQRRREGVIVKFNGDDWWEYKTRYALDTPYRDYRVAEILPFREKWVHKSETRYNQYLTAVGLLRGFIDGHLNATQVFDAKLLSRHLILMSLWGTVHPQIFDNIRLYLNPITMRLEPIGFDAQPALNAVRLSPAPPTWSLYRTAFDDPEFKRIYARELARIISEVQSSEFRTWLESREDHHVKILHRDNPFVPRGLINFLVERADGMAKFDRQSFATPADLALKIPTPPPSSYPNLINVFHTVEGNRRIVEIRNIVAEMVSVEDIFVKGKSIKSLLAASSPGIKFPQILDPRRYRQRVPSLRITLPDESPSTLSEIVVASRIVGQSKNYANSPIDYAGPAAASKLPAPNVAELGGSFSNFAWDLAAQTLTIPAGDWRIDTSIILPEGAGLTVLAGAKLFMAPGKFILLHGPLNIKGTAQQPVIIRGTSGQAGDGGTGIAVLNSGRPSTISHGVFENMSGIASNNWTTSGALTFFQSEVSINDARFAAITAEDALNIFDSKFQLSGTEFRDIKSDAIDLDFSDGSISRSAFRRIGGDAIDLSGSNVDIRGVVMEGVSDKGISVGEASRAQVTQVRISDAGTGIVSKDNSTTIVENSSFTRIRHTALMSYIKKTEYGPAVLEASNVTSSDVGKLGAVQTSSSLTINGEKFSPSDLDIGALYRDQFSSGNTD